VRHHLLLICVLTSAVFSVVTTELRQRQLPTRADWSAVTRELSEGLKPGDAVTWLPEWAEEGRLALKGLETRTSILYPPHHGGLDLARFERVWVIGALGATAEALVARSELKGEARREALRVEVVPEQPLKLLGERQRGRLSLGLVEPQGERSVADLFHDLADPARVHVSRQGRRDQRPRPCTLWALQGWHCQLRHAKLKRTLRDSGSLKGVKAQGIDDQRLVDRCLSRPLQERLKARTKDRGLYRLDRRRHLSYVDCGLHPEEHVSRDHRVIAGEPRRCVWLRPHEGKTLRVTWRTRTPPSAWLTLRYGWEDLSVDPPFRGSQAEPLALSVLEKDSVAPIFKRTLRPDVGWSAHTISIPDGPQARSFTITLNAPNGARDANLCVELSVRIEKP